MIVLVANSGRLEQATVELPKAISLQALDTLRIKLRSTITDKKFSDVAAYCFGFQMFAYKCNTPSLQWCQEQFSNVSSSINHF